MGFNGFVAGSSFLSALPTLLYVGMAQRKIGCRSCRADASIEEYLSIPFETIIVGILVAYGVTYSIIETQLQKIRKTET